MRRLALFVGLVVVAFGASAEPLGAYPSITPSTGGRYAINWNNSAQAANQVIRNIQAGVSAGAKVVDQVTMRHVSGTAIPVTITRGFSAGGMAAAAGRFITNPWFAAGMIGVSVVAELMNRDGIETESGVPMIDPGQPQQEMGGLMMGPYGGPWTPAQHLAKQKKLHQDAHNGPNTYVTFSNDTSGCSNGVCHYGTTTQVRWKDDGSIYFTITPFHQSAEVVALGCPKGDGTPRGGLPCPSDDRVPAPVQILTEALGKATPAEVAQIAQAVEAQRGQGWADALARSWETAAESPMAVDMPGMVGIGTSTKTNPDGTVETTEKKADCTWAANWVGCETITIKTGTDGTVTEETESGGGNETPTDCDKFPNSLGCIDAGTVPEGPELETDEREVEFEADDGWGDGNAACPQPKSFTVLGQPVQIDNTVLCGFFSGIRFAVIGAFGLAAVLIVVGGFKQG